MMTDLIHLITVIQIVQFELVCIAITCFGYALLGYDSVVLPKGGTVCVYWNPQGGVK